MVESGSNLSRCDVTGADVRRAYDIHGGDIAATKGKSKKRAVGDKAVRVAVTDKPKQVLYSDPALIEDENYLVSVAKPLGLLLTNKVPGLSNQPLGTALTSQMSTLRERDYVVEKVVTDRAKALIKIKGKLPGVVVEAVGAGDHVNIAENNIKTLKERIRCKKTDLAWRLPKRLKEPLVVYSTGRVNMIPPHSGSSSECARVRFLELKIVVPKELGISFGGLL